MRVFIAGAAGVVGQHLVPMLTAAGHEVTGTTRSPGKADQIRRLGATPVIMDGLDADGVRTAVKQSRPEVIIHQMTALSSMGSLRRFDREFAVTNQLRTTGTDNLLAAAQAAGSRRFIAQSYAG
jgi:2-alkyl-3-oxoalkanoate reductase